MALQTITRSTYSIMENENRLHSFPDGTASTILAEENRIRGVITYRFRAEPKFNLCALPIKHEKPWRNRKRFKRSQRK